jgi:hypothetical protein
MNGGIAFEDNIVEAVEGSVVYISEWVEVDSCEIYNSAQ